MKKENELLINLSLNETEILISFIMNILKFKIIICYFNK